MSSSLLNHLHDFERILRDYKPSLEILDILQTTKLVVMSGPAGSGRNTLINSLLMTGKYKFLISDTTRRPRINNGVPEVSGKDYWFRSEEEFLQGLKNGAYIEAAIIHNQQVSGISLNELRLAAQTGKIAITDVNPRGCDNIKSYSDTAVPVFILPPSFDEWMRRLDGRGVMDPAEKRRRLISAAEEIQLALTRSYFKFITNWDLRTTVEELHQHILSDDFNVVEQADSHNHANDLLRDLDAHLR
jgi:guanylate kinase